MDSFHLSLAGEIDMSRRDELTQAIESYLDSGQPDVTVDMSQVTFIDSTGLGMLVSLHVAGRERQGTVTLIDPGPTCIRLLELTHLDSMFEIEGQDASTAGQDRRQPAVG